MWDAEISRLKKQNILWLQLLKCEHEIIVLCDSKQSHHEWTDKMWA